MKGMLRMPNYSSKYQYRLLFIFSLVVLTLDFWSSKTRINSTAMAANIDNAVFSRISNIHNNVPDYKRNTSSSQLVYSHSSGVNDTVADTGHHQTSSRERLDYADSAEESELRNGSLLDDNDTEGIGAWEHEHSQQNSSEEDARAFIAKCCHMGEALGTDGTCQKIVSAYKHDLTWHPQSVYRVDGGIWTHFNLSEWDVDYPYPLDCYENETEEILSDLFGSVLLSNGQLLLMHKVVHTVHDAPTKRLSLLPGEFCFDKQIDKEARSGKVCVKKEHFGGNSKTLRKCCLGDWVYIMVNKTRFCIKPSEPKDYPDNWEIVYGAPRCEHGLFLSKIASDETITVGNDGTFIGANLRAPFLDYCLDYIELSELGQESNLQVMVCLEEPFSLMSIPAGLNIACGVGFIVSSICLCLAALILVRLPEFRSLHGKYQLNHLATLFSLCVSLATAHLGSHNIFGLRFCAFLAVATHFFALSSFLWLNILCVNIYLTFRSLRPPSVARRGETRRLILLCIYAWGIPAAFCMLLYILDKPGRLDPLPRPQYGKLTCFISNRGAQLAYFFGPVGILLLLNGVLFCLTAKYLLCGLWRQENSDSMNFRRKSMGIVVAKLGIVMGMGWILEVISWIGGQKYSYLFYSADVFNSLQGLFIFIVLICRKRVLQVLRIQRP